jgi:hypothetical protein
VDRRDRRAHDQGGPVEDAEPVPGIDTLHA